MMTGNPVFDYSKLRGRIVEKFGVQSAFASAIGMSEGTLSSKLTNKSYFSAAEIMAACDLLDVRGDDLTDYFFTVRSEKI